MVFANPWKRVHGTHYLCSRPGKTAREHCCHFGHPCTRAVETGRY